MVRTSVLTRVVGYYRLPYMTDVAGEPTLRLRGCRHHVEEVRDHVFTAPTTPPCGLDRSPFDMGQLLRDTEPPEPQRWFGPSWLPPVLTRGVGDYMLRHGSLSDV